jgi:hypothetical protein
MTVPLSLLSPLAGFGRRIRSWWDRQRTLHELGQCDGRDLQRVLHELNVTEPELNDAVIRGAYPKLLLPEMVQALGLKGESIDKDYPRIADDLKRVCSQCPDKKRCRHQLDARTAASNYREFCYNATTLEALTGEAAGKGASEGAREGPGEDEADSSRM